MVLKNLVETYCFSVNINDFLILKNYVNFRCYLVMYVPLNCAIFKVLLRLRPEFYY